jgi:hypothetical protein
LREQEWSGSSQRYAQADQISKRDEVKEKEKEKVNGEGE